MTNEALPVVGPAAVTRLDAGRLRHQVTGAVAAAGLGFQAVHAFEHVVQTGAWVAAPSQPPFLTPWAVAGRDILAVGGNSILGTELLHLVGNLVFMAGLVAFALLGAVSAAGSRRSLLTALAVQGVHVAEHVALTATVAVTGRAIGATTLFGLLEAGPRLWTLRVMAHLALNLSATSATTVAAVMYMRASRETAVRRRSSGS